MATSFARGTLTGKRITGPVAAPTPAEAPSEAELAGMTTAARVDRLLLPQHAALRAAGAMLRSAAGQLVTRGAGNPAVMDRVLGVADDLAVAMAEHFDLEERALFPAMTAGRPATAVTTAIHEHHEQLAARVRWLQLLAADVRATAGLTYDTMALFAGMAAVVRLARRHRELEQWVVLSRWS